MKEREFLLKMDEALDFSPGTLARDKKLSSLPLWDSMQQLAFMAMAQEMTGVVLEGTVVGSAKTVDDLLRPLDGCLE